MPRKIRWSAITQRPLLPDTEDLKSGGDDKRRHPVLSIMGEVNRLLLKGRPFVKAITN
jgi:hypothetical protein